MGFDVQAVRDHFPALAEGAAHFDGPGGSQVPDVVAEAVARVLTSAVSNRDRLTASGRRADDIVLAARTAMGDFVGVDPRGIVFGRSMTQLTYDFARTLAKTWTAGDEVVVTRLDHDANIRPWVQAAAAEGVTVRWVDFDPKTGELSPGDIAAVLSERTRLVAVTAASNLIGTRPPVREIADLVHAAGALLYVDGVHYAAHSLVDVTGIGADFFACSPYKFCGPHLGVLAARPERLESLMPDKLLPSANEVPERFEFGTLPYELLAGTTAAVDFLAGLTSPDGDRRQRLQTSLAAVQAHEDELRERLESQLAAWSRVEIYSRAARRTPTLLLSVDGHTPASVARHLAERGVNAPAGSFYAIEASRTLGLDDTGAVRLGLAPYNDSGDIDRALAAIGELASE
ncbi:MAG TPA: cysteine desulfurase-like protein [Jatrophihabitantaceae bacterium]|jgi:cysteine desulfurase family protein (TIGR01976 family)